MKWLEALSGLIEHSALGLIALIFSCVSIWGCLGASVEYDRRISLPIEFFNFADDPRLTQIRRYSGPPGIDHEGVEYFRSGQWFVIQSVGGVQRTIDLVAVSAGAIDRDVLRGSARWDRKVDLSQMIDDRVVVDRSGGIYTIITPKASNLKTAILLYSLDRAVTWRAVRLEGLTGSLEAWDGFNDKGGVPVVSTIDRYGSVQGTRTWVQRFVVRGGEIVPAFSPVLISNKSALVSKHSGGSNTTFTRLGRIFVVYPSVEMDVDGTNIYIREVDANTGKIVTDEIWLGVAGGVTHNKLYPADPHDIPAITENSQGIITVIFGAHQGLFQSVSSNVANSILGGWSPPEVIGEPRRGGQYGSYTYISAITDFKDNIHIFSRSEGYKYKFQLVQMERYSNGKVRTWSGGLRHRVVVDTNRSMYAAWRQRVSMDDRGCIYLHFKYWPGQLSSGERLTLGLAREKADECRDGRCFVRALEPLFPTTIMSCDNGENFTVISHRASSE